MHSPDHIPAATPRDRCRVVVLGSTGSIGTQTLEVIAHLNGLHAAGKWPTRYEIVAIAAGRNEPLITEQARTFNVPRVALAADDPSALTRLIHDTECDLVVAAMTGIAGLPAILAAVERGRDVALANKETLVAAGALVSAAAKKSGSRLLPVDSEHSALWQCLSRCTHAAPPLTVGAEVARIVLTASGGPFRTWSAQQLASATPEEALKHPTWSMGRKNTIDSASLVNKALEVIEAHWLFGLAPAAIEVLIHPQSLIHAMVEFADGSLLTQMGAPDMRLPIQHALCYPSCAPAPWRKLALGDLRALDFEPPDTARFPALRLAYRAMAEGGSSGATLNAAAEAATSAFLDRRLAFDRIGPLIEATMEALPPRELSTLNDVLDADARARARAGEFLGRI